MQSPLLDRQQLKDWFGVSERTLYIWSRDLGFPTPIKITPRQKRWIREEVEEWIQSRERDNSALRGVA